MSKLDQLLFKQSFFWEAELESGEIIKEKNGNYCKDLELSRVETFSLNGPLNISINLKTGEFFNHDTKIVFPKYVTFFKLPVDYSPGLIQYKEARVNHSSQDQSNSEEFIIEKYYIGWKVEYSCFIYQVTCEVLENLEVNFRFLKIYPRTGDILLDSVITKVNVN